jgi:hypothetical protein
VGVVGSQCRLSVGRGQLLELRVLANSFAPLKLQGFLDLSSLPDNRQLTLTTLTGTGTF